MGKPALVFNDHGAKVVPDSTGQFINFDDETTNLANGEKRTLHVEGVNYQVPVGKELIILGADLFQSGGGVGLIKLIYADDLDGNLNGVDIYFAPNNPIKAKLNFIVPAGKYVNEENLFAGSNGNSLNGCVAVEYTP